MAYSLADPYRPLRLVFRINGIVIGLLVGALLLLASPGLLQRAGVLAMNPALDPAASSLLLVRVAGVALIGAGLFLLGNASAREIDMAQMIPCIVFHLLLAIVLIVGWFRQDLAGLNLAGQIGLLLVFALCLVGALAPVRYFSAEYRF